MFLVFPLSNLWARVEHRLGRFGRESRILRPTSLFSLLSASIALCAQNGRATETTINCRELPVWWYRSMRCSEFSLLT